jgi:hypothetical protein
MRRELTELSAEISRSLRDSFREEARQKMPILTLWHDLQRLPDSVVTHRMLIDTAPYLARFYSSLREMPDERQHVVKFMRVYTDLVIECPIFSPTASFTYHDLFNWLIAGGVQAGLNRYPYYVDFVPEYAYLLEQRACFREPVHPRTPGLTIQTPIDLGYDIVRGQVPTWVPRDSSL